MRARATLALAALACCACPKSAPPSAHVVDAGAAASPASLDAPAARGKLLAITKDGVGALGAGQVTTAVVARVFLDGVADGAIDERTESSEGEIVGRALSVKRAGTVEAVVHVDNDGALYSVEITAPIAEANGVRVGDVLAKALGGGEDVSCARGAEERADMVFCARAREPHILYGVAPPASASGPDGRVPQDVLRALPLAALVWTPQRR